VLSRWPSVPRVREGSIPPTEPSVVPAPGRLQTPPRDQPTSVVLSSGTSRRNHPALGLPATATMIVTVQFGDLASAC